MESVDLWILIVGIPRRVPWRLGWLRWALERLKGHLGTPPAPDTSRHLKHCTHSRHLRQCRECAHSIDNPGHCGHCRPLDTQDTLPIAEGWGTGAGSSPPHLTKTLLTMFVVWRRRDGGVPVAAPPATTDTLESPQWRPFRRL